MLLMYLAEQSAALGSQARALADLGQEKPHSSEDMLSILERAEGLAARGGDKYGQIELLERSSSILLELGRLDEAWSLAERAWAVQQQIPPKVFGLEGSLLHCMGEIR